VVIVCTDTPDLDNLSSKFLIFPNPSNGLINIHAIEKMEIFIYNALLELIIHQEIRDGSNVIEISDKPNGIYYIRIQKGEYNELRKVIKN